MKTEENINRSRYVDNVEAELKEISGTLLSVITCTQVYQNYKKCKSRATARALYFAIKRGTWISEFTEMVFFAGFKRGVITGYDKDGFDTGIKTTQILSALGLLS